MKNSFDLYITKVDFSGNKIWTKTFTDASIGSEGYCIKETSDGDYIISGAKSSSIDMGDYDAWLVKTDTNGNKLWENTYGWTGSNEVGYSFDITSDGGFVITGFSGNGEVKEDYVKLLLIKTDSNGI